MSLHPTAPYHPSGSNPSPTFVTGVGVSSSRGNQDRGDKGYYCTESWIYTFFIWSRSYLFCFVSSPASLSLPLCIDILLQTHWLLRPDFTRSGPLPPAIRLSLFTVSFSWIKITRRARFHELVSVLGKIFREQGENYIE